MAVDTSMKVEEKALADSPKPLLRPIQIGLHQLKHRSDQLLHLIDIKIFVD